MKETISIVMSIVTVGVILAGLILNAQCSLNKDMGEIRNDTSSLKSRVTRIETIIDERLPKPVVSNQQIVKKTE